MNKKIKIQEVKENDINIDAETKNETAAQKPKSLIIKIEDLVPFEEHPYKVTDDDNMAELVKSISEYGIMNPLIVRPKEDGDGKYEIISGHRRLFAAQKLGLKKMPCTVHYVDRDTATVMMVDSNCQRTELLPSEKAKAFKMKMDAMNRQGKRTDLTSDPVGPKSERSNEKLAESVNESVTQIKRYIRLNFLIPELLQFVDEGKIKMRPAVEMSYLGEETQRDIVDCIDESGGEVFPSHAQTRRIREQAENGGISYEEVAAIMKEEKPNQVEKVKIPTEELRKRIGKNLTDEAFIKYLYDAVDYYKKYLQRQREQAR
ncbi:MAG: ParB/RepB/Spo0J family partition protein [Oscillospiraceae bacterium]|nr:ParB/RepB/Spo0J family partition protein [Oscillospiraceae bacterium]